MFFSYHTTPFEQSRGSVNASMLLARFADEFRQKSTTEFHSVTEVSIAIGSDYYGLGLDIDFKDWSNMGLYWLSGYAQDRQMVAFETQPFRGSEVPLTWGGLVPLLSEHFILDPSVVWDAAVDLHAYWAQADESEAHKIPPTYAADDLVLGILYPSERGKR